MKRRILSFITAITILTSLAPMFTLTASAADAPIKLGDYVQMGTYDTNGDNTAEPILWRCVAFEKVKKYENGVPVIDSTDAVTEYKEGYLPLMLADTAVCNKAFDKEGGNKTGSHGRDKEISYEYERGALYGSNYWGDSNIRDWLKGDYAAETHTNASDWSCGNAPYYKNEAGFMTNFSDTEKAAVKTVKQKSLLAFYDIDISGVSGKRVHMKNENIADIVQNYTTAYSEWVTDTMFLLDVQQIYNVYKNYKDYYKLSDYYFLRSPYSENGSSVRVVVPSGSVDYGSANYNWNGIRPAFFLNPSSALEGNGTKDAPYSVSFDGAGTEADPYLIPSLAALELLRDKVNGGETYEGKHFKLTADIDMSGKYSESTGKSWTPIGTAESIGGNETPFRGIFDGDGHSVKGLYIDADSETPFQGLFGFIGNGAAVKNLSVYGSIKGGIAVGGICGYNGGGRIENCRNFVDIQAYSMAGGLTGHNYIGGVIEKCFNKGTITVEGSNSSYVGGGICGYNYGTVKSCGNVGNVTAKNMVGGIASYNVNIIENCYSSAVITKTGEDTDAVISAIAYDVNDPDVSQGTTTGCYYNNELYTSAAANGTGKTTAEFEDGTVAYLLQSGQTEQIWGQTLSGTKDAYPILTSDSEKKVYKVTFATQSNSSYAVRYANAGGIGTLPTAPTPESGYAFCKWSKTNSADGEEFTANTKITEDITVYAVKQEQYGEESGEHKIETTYGTAATLDLSTCVGYSGATSTEGKFTYTIQSGNTGLDATISGDMLTVPSAANASGYTLTIKAHEKEPQASLFSVNSLGTEDFTFKVGVFITPKTISDNMILDIANQTYTGAAIAPIVTVKDGSTTLVNGTDYTVSYENNTNAGTATVKITGKGNYTGTASKNFTISPKTITDSMISAVSEKTYTGTEIEPTVTVTDGSTTLKENTDYTVSCSDNVNAGTATVKVTGKGNYAGEISKTFTIKQIIIDATAAAAETRQYDGTNKVKITDVTLDGVVGGDNVSVNTDNLTGTVESVNVGEYTKVTLQNMTLTGDKKDNYTLHQPNITLNTSVRIEKADAPEAAKGTQLNIANNLEKEYSYLLSRLCPQINTDGSSVQKDWGAREYEIVSVAFQDGYYDNNTARIDKAENPDVSGGNVNNTLYLPIKFKDIADEGVVGTVTIKIKSANYNDFENSFDVAAYNKDAVTFSITPQNSVYSSNPWRGYTGEPTITDTSGNPVTLTPEIRWSARVGTGYNEKTEPPTNAGTYSVIFRVADTDEKYIGKNTFNFEIAKAQGSGSVTMDSWTYGQMASVPVPQSETNGTESVSYMYKAQGADDSEYKTEKPKNVGNYTVKATFAEVTNYNAVIATADFEIAKATPNITAPDNITAFVGQKLSDISLPDGWSWKDNTQGVGNAGTHNFDAIFTPSDTDNYTTVNASISVKVDYRSGSVELKPGESIIKEDVTITNNEDGTVTIDKGDDGTPDTTITMPESGDVTVDKDGNITVPSGGNVQTGDGAELTLPNGGNADKDGNVTGEKVVSGDTTITAPTGETVKTDKDGNTTVPSGGKVQTGDGAELTLPNGGNADKDGNVTGEKVVSGDTTITAPTGETVKTDKDGNTTVPIGTTIEKDGTKITVVEGDNVTVDKDGNISFSSGGKADIEKDGKTYTVDVTTDGKVDFGNLPTPPKKPHRGGGSSIKATPKPTETPITEPTETDKPTPTNKPGDNWFTDVPENAWYYNSVKYVFENGLMLGVSDTEFKPLDNITRGMFVTVLYRTEGEPEINSQSTFADIDGAYYTNAIKWANENKIVEGYSNEIFAPEENITREQMAAIVYRYAKFKQYDTDIDSGLSYSDNTDISDYAKDAVIWSGEHGIMLGNDDNTFNPLSNTTRAQAAAVFERIVKNFK